VWDGWITEKPRGVWPRRTKKGRPRKKEESLRKKEGSDVAPLSAASRVTALQVEVLRLAEEKRQKHGGGREVGRVDGETRDAETSSDSLYSSKI